MHSNGNGTAAKYQDNIVTLDEAMPNNQDAENAVLGSILIDPDAFYEVDSIVGAGDFYSKQRGEVYKAMSDLYHAKTPVDIITVSEVLVKRGITNIGVESVDSFLIGLLSFVPTAVNARSYAQVVEADATRRRLILAGRAITNKALNHSGNINELLGESEAALFSVTSKSATHNVTHIKSALSKFYDAVQARQASDQPPGISTGFASIDRIIDGLKGGRTYVIAARPGMGKSVLENNITSYATRRLGKRAVKFNMEMDNFSILQRQISATTGIPYEKIEKGTMDAAEFSRFTTAVGELSTLNIWMDDSSELSFSQLRARATRIHMEHGLDLLTVDYLTLMKADSKNGTRTEDVGRLSRGLHSLAKDLNIPIIILAQLSRSCEARGDKRPLLSDLRDSGEIEQDADVVMFIYRDDYYTGDACTRPNVAEINIAKNRHGNTGTAELYFNGALMRFNDLGHE